MTENKLRADIKMQTGIQDNQQTQGNTLDAYAIKGANPLNNTIAN